MLHETPCPGDKASVLGWKWSFLIAVRAISKPFHEGLKKIEDNMNGDFRNSRLSLSAEDGNGYQAWQPLLRARTARNATNLLNQLLEPTFTSPDLRINRRQRNKNAEEHATRTGERVSEGIRRAVHTNEIAPQDTRQHLMLNQSRQSTAEEAAQEIEDTGMQPRSFRVMTRTKLDSLLRESHEITHCPFRAWCEICVKAKSPDGKHAKRVGIQSTFL